MRGDIYPKRDPITVYVFQEGADWVAINLEEVDLDDPVGMELLEARSPVGEGPAGAMRRLSDSIRSRG